MMIFLTYSIIPNRFETGPGHRFSGDGNEFPFSLDNEGLPPVLAYAVLLQNTLEIPRSVNFMLRLHRHLASLKTEEIPILYQGAIQAGRRDLQGVGLVRHIVDRQEISHLLADQGAIVDGDTTLFVDIEPDEPAGFHPEAFHAHKLHFLSDDRRLGNCPDPLFHLFSDQTHNPVGKKKVGNRPLISNDDRINLPKQPYNIGKLLYLFYLDQV